jgi:hypothetical protein
LIILEATKEQIIWGGNYFADLLPPSMRWLIWDKAQRDFSLADFEMAWTSQQKAARAELATQDWRNAWARLLTRADALGVRATVYGLIGECGGGK